MQQELSRYKNIRFLLGDVRDERRLEQALEGIDIVYHTAALKHVLACEYNPFEALKTNILGAQNLIEASIKAGVKKALLTSTDKATNPCSAMGVSKLMAEKLFTAANYYKGRHKTVFATVRFGNVLGSRGSVIPLLEKQIKDGGPVTITDYKMTRFVMTIEQALRLIFTATAFCQGGEIFIPKMEAVRIYDLIIEIIKKLAPRYGYSPKDIRIKKIGSQPGEKLYEELLTPEEELRALELRDMFILLPSPNPYWDKKYEYTGARKVKKVVSSRDRTPLSPREIRGKLEKLI
jgi:FlaA1/EpsC-like NDP-sugar epimerase